MPLSCSRSSGPPLGRPSTMHGNHPRSLPIRPHGPHGPQSPDRHRKWTRPHGRSLVQHTTGSPNQTTPDDCSPRTAPFNGPFPTPLNPHRASDWTPPTPAEQTTIRSELTVARRDSTGPNGPCHHARPETHQNLIHPDKEHLPPPETIRWQHQRRRHRAFRRVPTGPSRITPQPAPNRLLLCDTYPNQQPAGSSTSQIINRTADQSRPIRLVRPALSTALVETIGIEPTTPCLQSRCSPS